MSLRNIIAVVECDGCGCEMRFDVDTGADIPSDWDLHAVAIDAVRGGVNLRYINGKPAGPGATSVQDGDCLCPVCTKERDMSVPYE